MSLPSNSVLLRAAQLGSALLISMAPVQLFSSGAVLAQGMNMPGMGAPKQAAPKTATGTGTVTALNVANRKVFLDHGPMPQIDWPAMKMEFPVAASVDLSKIKTGDKVQFTISGSGSSYTVQSISPSP